MPVLVIYMIRTRYLPRHVKVLTRFLSSETWSLGCNCRFHSRFSGGSCDSEWEEKYWRPLQLVY